MLTNLPKELQDKIIDYAILDVKNHKIFILIKKLQIIFVKNILTVEKQ